MRVVADSLRRIGHTSNKRGMIWTLSSCLMRMSRTSDEQRRQEHRTIGNERRHRGARGLAKSMGGRVKGCTRKPGYRLRHVSGGGNPSMEHEALRLLQHSIRPWIDSS